jgi:hypothetical protein
MIDAGSGTYCTIEMRQVRRPASAAEHFSGRRAPTKHVSVGSGPSTISQPGVLSDTRAPELVARSLSRRRKRRWARLSGHLEHAAPCCRCNSRFPARNSAGRRGVERVRIICEFSTLRSAAVGCRRRRRRRRRRRCCCCCCGCAANAFACLYNRRPPAAAVRDQRPTLPPCSLLIYAPGGTSCYNRAVTTVTSGPARPCLQNCSLCRRP